MADLKEGSGALLTEEGTGNPLYDACVGFMVSERTGTDSWDKVARQTQELVNNGLDAASIKEQFRLTEAQIKHDFRVTSLPGAWRSAKSEAIKAVEVGVALVFEGHTVPKTELARRVRAMKGSTAKPSASVPRSTGDNGLDIAMAIGRARSLIHGDFSCMQKPILVGVAKKLVDELEATTCA